VGGAVKVVLIFSCCAANGLVMFGDKQYAIQMVNQVEQLAFFFSNEISKGVGSVNVYS
jgi:hypothetical protein